MKNKNIVRIVLITAFILMIPLLAMQFTDEVNWDLADFVVMGALLLGVGFTYELIAGKMSNTAHRAVLAIVLGAVLILTWMELAVGIFGTPFAGS